MIRELLKPPFIKCNGHIRDANGIILATLWADTSIIARIYGKPDIYKPMKPINDFVFDAVCEKWERDFGGKDETKHD